VLNQVLIASLALAASLAPIQAQVTAAISGRVADPKGVGVGGATVTVKSVETGASRSVTTDEGGNYTVLSLPLGAQEVRAEKKDFKVAIRTGVDLTVGQDAVVNLSLELGELAQQVTVSGESPVVNTTIASISGLVGERDIKELPLNGRSYDNLITLNPSAINYSAYKSANTTTSDGNTFSVDGRRPQDNIFLLNGIEDTGASQLAVTPGGVSGQMLGIDAVREFNLLSDNYGAEYGKRAGGQVVVVTQSGSNALHGSLFEFLRNSALDASGIFNNGVTPLFHRNQFGGAAGGPLKKDRLFLFGNYEGYRQSLAVSSVSDVPDAQARQGFLPNSAGVETQVAKLNPAMLPFLALWPQGNGPELGGGIQEAFYNPLNTVHEDFANSRLDYYLNSRDRLSAIFTVDTGHSIIPLADPLFASGLRLASLVGSLEETHVISPSILNTFRAGFSRAGFNYDYAASATFPSSLSFVSGAQPGVIAVNSGLTGGGGNLNDGVWDRRNLYTYTDQIQITKGIHQFSAGGWLQWVQDNEDLASRRLGDATFSTLTTLLQGTLVNFQVVPDHNALGWRSLFGAWFVQDTMKIRPNLTFSIGLRDEFTTGYNEDSGRAANFITDSNGVLLTNPRVGDSAFTQNNATHLLGPRVGLAWDPFGKGKTAVRAGFGTYYSLIDALSFLLSALPPNNGSATFTGSLPSLLPITSNVPVPLACGTPGALPSPQCSTFAPQGIQPNAQTLTVEQWNLSVQQQISSNMAFRVAYVGSHGYHGLLSVDPNSIPAQVCQTSSGCVTGGDLPTSTSPCNLSNPSLSPTVCSLVPQGAQYIPFGGRPNPNLSAGFFWYTEGNSSYNALQLDFTRRISRGLQLRLNYTWSKNLDMNSGLTVAQSSNQPQMEMNRFDLPRDWGPSALNPPQQASLSGTYQLPFGKNGGMLERRTLGGWQLNGIVTLLSGFPFTPLIGVNRSGDGNTRNPDRPSLNPSFTGPVIVGTQAQWFNPQAFILPAAGTWGNLGRGVYSGPGFADVDFSVFKNIPVSERVNLQFRSEFFNLLNHMNLGAPNATAFSGTAYSPTAGQITSLATTPRQIQFGLKLIF